MNTIKDVCSGINPENFDDLIKAQSQAGKLADKGQQQYSTPEWFAKILAVQLPNTYVSSVLDPQCAGGNTLLGINCSHYLGIEVDKRFCDTKDRTSRIQSNCVDIAQMWDELYPEHKCDIINANPPFGMSWKDGEQSIDSTLWTWKFAQRMTHEKGSGYFIAGRKTIEKFGIHEAPGVYLYQTFVPGLWDNVRIEIGVVHWTKYNTPERQVIDYGAEFFTLTERERMLLMTSIALPRDYGHTSTRRMTSIEWDNIKMIRDEERKGLQSGFNIDLDKQGNITTYLSTRKRLKLSHRDLQNLALVHGSHPLQLTTERETRKLLSKLHSDGTYTISKPASDAIEDALRQVNIISAPIRPVSDFGTVAYAEEEDHLESLNPATKVPEGRNNPIFVQGKRYEFVTGSYTFTRTYNRQKVKFSEEKGTFSDRHQYELKGVDRFIQIADEKGIRFRFMEHPTQSAYDLPESLLWSFFVKPDIPTIVDLDPDSYKDNLASMEINEMLAGFTYFDGQRDYYARMAMKDYGLIGADTGTGKSLGAITLSQLKHPKRSLIIAPQGTMRGSDGQMEDFDNAAQWVQELRNFAPTEPVFQLFSEDDYREILRRNRGKLPNGIYISYPTAMFRNKSYEFLPPSWSHMKFCELFQMDPGPLVWHADVVRLDGLRSGELVRDQIIPSELSPHNLNKGSRIKVKDGIVQVKEIWPEPTLDYTENVGAEKNGIRCIATPCLATMIEEEERLRHTDRSIRCPWDMILLDEAHLICNVTAQITQTFIRQQPKYRYALTATPIPNIVSNLFSLMGWLCVPDWHNGKSLNAAWPYHSGDISRFNNTFLCHETDLTQASIDLRSGKRPRGAATSPIISSPARLLKLISHTLAHISKDQCNAKQVPATIVDIRVPLGKQQMRAYGHFMNRGNIMFTKAKKPVNPLTRAMMQSGILRGICSDPHGWTGEDYQSAGNCNKELLVHSNFNAKTVTILQLVQEILERGENVVVVNARVGQTNELADRLRSAEIEFARIDSKVAPKDHAANANLFKQGKVRVLFMGIKCAQAYSFDKCPNLIIGSLEWSYGTLHQALGRIHRLTSPKAVKAWVVLHKNSIEEALYDRVAQKKDAATICLLGERLPSDYKTFDADEVLAQHLIDFEKEGDTVCETECELKWPTLLEKLRQAI